jgi:type II restriction enzyme
MNLTMTGSLAAAYTSGAQRARVVTEAWGEQNLFCPNCSSPKLTWLEPGHPASDYSCPRCGFWFQLKSQRAPIRDSITDGAYGSMMKAIQNDEAPSYYFMQYEITPSPPQRGGEGRGEVAQLNSPHPVPLPAQSRGEGMLWSVRNLLLVPHFAFPPSAIIKRKPLSVTARRAGWVGCNFALDRIPVEARIEIITTRSSGRASAHLSPGSQSRLTSAATIIVPPAEVREKFKRVKPLKDLSVKQRGWALDVLNIVRRVVGTTSTSSHSSSKKRDAVERIPTNTFTNEEVYAFARELEQLHPDNRHVRDKIRQQLQVLRDAKLLIHVGSGVWALP